MCKQESSSEKSTKIYTRKELVIAETKNLVFVPVSTYQPLKVSLSLTTCAHTWYKSLWLNATHSLQTSRIISIFLCRRDYAERVVASFSNQIQSE